MTTYKYTLIALLVVGVMMSALGCASAAKDTTGFSKEQSLTVQQPFADCWQTVKHVLRTEGYDIYTRDKRGTFVAYSPVKRKYFQPKRVKYTIDLEAITAEDTRIHVEAVRQIYGVTLLTYPDWHDRQLVSEADLAQLVTLIQQAMTVPAK